jgi:ethanolamine utilization cobalamin adenosyltransferase
MQEEIRVNTEPALEMAKTEKYRPSNKEALREYELNIRFLNRGCIVRVGCKEIAFESAENAMKAVNDYVANPWEEQEKWRKILD